MVNIVQPPLKEKEQVYSQESDYLDKSPFVTTNFQGRRYFSGLDVEVYFENIKIYECVNIQYQVTEDVLPLIGYHGYVYTTVARGARIIQGSMTINFQESGLLKKIIAKSFENKRSSSPINNTQRAMNFISQPSNASSYNNISNKQREENANNNKKLFWQKAAEYSKNTSSTPNNIPMFGDLLSDIDGFDIYIKYGDLGSLGTMDILKGVQIMGSGKVIDDSGRNVLEVINFMARDIIG